MHVLVTGGAGYIGSHMVDALIQTGYRVTVIDDLSMGHRAAVHPKAEFIQASLLDPSAVQALFEGREFGGIFHFAGHTMVGESNRAPWLYLRDNPLAASYLLEAAVQHGVERFVFSSTSNLFDEPHRIPIAESERINPASPYGESKAIIEHQLKWMYQLYGLQYASLRYFNAAGAHPQGHIGEDHTPETHLIPLVLQVALGQREQIAIFGDDYPTEDGTCIRDYVHVMDLVQAHLLAFDALATSHTLTYNLGIGQGYSVQAVIETARQVTEHPIPSQVVPRRPGDPPILISDSAAIRRELGWEPNYTSLEVILETAWHWHRHHPQGYATVKP